MSDAVSELPCQHCREKTELLEATRLNVLVIAAQLNNVIQRFSTSASAEIRTRDS